MNPLTDNAAARSWSGRLGSLAAEMPPVRPANIVGQPAVPTPLSAILQQLRQRTRTRESVADQLRAKEFLLAP